MRLDDERTTYFEKNTTDRKQTAFLSDLDVSNFISLTHEDLQDPELVPVTSVEMLQEQQNNYLCREIVAKEQINKNLAFHKLREAFCSN